jgi:hypothetical protein
MQLTDSDSYLNEWPLVSLAILIVGIHIYHPSWRRHWLGEFVYHEVFMIFLVTMERRTSRSSSNISVLVSCTASRRAHSSERPPESDGSLSLKFVLSNSIHLLLDCHPDTCCGFVTAVLVWMSSDCIWMIGAGGDVQKKA